jgi:hypothetical protein
MKQKGSQQTHHKYCHPRIPCVQSQRIPGAREHLGKVTARRQQWGWPSATIESGALAADRGPAEVPINQCKEYKNDVHTIISLKAW